MLDGVRDTIITHTFDKVCVIGASCKIHNHTHHTIVYNTQEPNLINTLFEDSSMYIYENQWGQLLYLDEQITKFEPKVEVKVEPTPVLPFRESDTIKPCDSKWLIKGKELELKPIISHKTELTMAQPYQYSDLSNSIVMMLMLLATSIWLYRSTFYWLEMIRKINNIVKS
jgi:hypothetical protein